MFKKTKYYHVVIIITLVFSHYVQASNNINLKIKKGIHAEANYIAGSKDKPVVVVLHGFLQTNSYLTLSNLIEAAVEKDYAVLAPVDTLGINNRKISISCQSIHKHTMSESLDEIHQWMKWLKSKGHNNVILIGHSFGSVKAIAYLSKYGVSSKIPKINKVIGLSLIDTEFVPDRKRREQGRKNARKRLKQKDNDIHTYRLSYCHIYRAPAKAFLSYADWTSGKILSTLKNITKNVEVISILGSKDKRVPDKWPAKQRDAGATVNIVKGANHFFGGSQQIDLLDLLDEVLGM